MYVRSACVDGADRKEGHATRGELCENIPEGDCEQNNGDFNERYAGLLYEISGEEEEEEMVRKMFFECLIIL